jgi:hypothetical protein
MGDEFVGEYDTCTNLRTTANRLTRGVREGKVTMSVQNNNIVDRRVACNVNPRAPVCTMPFGSNQVRNITAMVVDGQIATTRSVEHAWKMSSDRNNRYRMAACQRIQDQIKDN